MGRGRDGDARWGQLEEFEQSQTLEEQNPPTLCHPPLPQNPVPVSHKQNPAFNNVLE